jgi:hypothetical protein
MGQMKDEEKHIESALFRHWKRLVSGRAGTTPLASPSQGGKGSDAND